MFARRTHSMLHLAAVTVVAALFVTADAAADKIKITKLDELPRHTYDVEGKPSEILASDEQMSDLAARVKKDILEVLDKYEIDDPNTMQGYYTALSQIAMLENDFSGAQDYIEKARKLEQKEAQKLMMGTIANAFIKAHEANDDPASGAFKASMRESVVKRLDEMPWDVVQDLVQQLNAQVQMLSESLLIGLVQNQMDGAVEKTGNLSGDQAKQLIAFKGVMKTLIPYKEEVGGVLAATVAAHAETKEDIWSERSVTLTGDEGYTPVVVGVWDSGVDVEVFGESCYTNPNEKPDGRDTDKNGFVDDVHGIGYDLHFEPTPDLLYPLGDEAANRRALEDQAKAFVDLTSGVQSEEAAALSKRLSEMKTEDVKPFVERLTLYSYHAHGTHVAGIAAEGNPYARILTARLSFDHHMVPLPFTVELAERAGKAFRATVDYFKENEVRVVNMSWGLSVKEVEQMLEVNGIGKDADERAEMAREMFAIVKNELRDALAGAPNILFLVAAGNADNDVEFDEIVPSSFDLPNVLVAGAVDQAGEPTVFTSYGRTVAVYANGFEVESYVPGGRRIKFSGTSMSSPNVANLAAKLIACDPSLEPAQVIELIKQGAENRGDDRPLYVINPKKSMELLMEGRKSG